MSFSKAPIKRFNDIVNDTPAPGQYDVKEIGPSGSGVAIVKSDRFTEPKEILPGPGQYDVDIKKPLIRTSKLSRASSLRGFRSGNMSKASSSATSSTTSLHIDVDDNVSFKTPLKKVAANLDNRELQEKYDQVCRDLKSAQEELARTRATSDEARRELEDKVAGLASGIQEKETELSTKLSELEKATDERDEAEKRLADLQSDIEAIRCRELSLKEELEMVSQDNASLEEKVTEMTKALLAEKSALEEKSTFLHFTQEQLNLQVGHLEEEVGRLKAEVDDLRAKLDASEKELESERNKLAEFTEMYVKENEETQGEFTRLQKTLADLKVEKDGLEVSMADLRTKLNELETNLATVTKEKNELKDKMEEASTDVEVLTNDKEVLDSERRRLEHEKGELELDLAGVSAEKMNVEKRLKLLEDEKAEFTSRVQNLLDEKEKLEQQVCMSFEERSSLETKLKDINDVALKQKISLDAKDSIIGDLQLEIEGLEMKTSALEGSLCASQNEVANLESENKALFGSFEKVEETVRGYIHKCQDLELQIEDLLSIKADLNQTCIILEERMKAAELALKNKTRDFDDVSALLKEKDALLERQRGDMTSLETKCMDLSEMIDIVRANHATSQEIAQETEAGLRRKLAEVEESLQRSRDEKDQLLSELETLKGDHHQLMNLNKVLSQQVSENLSTNQKLTLREEELNKRLEKAIRDLEAAHQGISTEVDQRWQAEDEILQLQAKVDEISAMLQEATEQNKSLYAKLDETDAMAETALKAKANLEARLTQANQDHNQTASSLAVITQEQEELSSRLQREVELRSNLEKKLKLALESKELLTERVDLQQEELCSLQISLTTQQQLISQQESKIALLEDELEGADKLAARYQESESLLAEYMADMKEMEAKEAALIEECRLKDHLITDLQRELDPLQGESTSYKEKYEALLSMIEPFREQLESYETEKAALLSQNQEAQGAVKKLATQYAQLLGHQNHKQKIQHLVRLKEENVSMREQMSKLQLENAKQKRTIARLEAEAKSAATLANRTAKFNATQMEDKENNESLFYTPLAAPPRSMLAGGALAKVPFAASTPANIRRQTIASPLTSRNRP